jgi:nucleotide-binding universal stress UspA family protein
MFPLRTVLHATDFSDSSAAAFRVACTLARAYDARLVVIHVQPAPATVRQVGRSILDEDARREELLRQMHDSWPEAGPARLEYRVLTGDPAEEVLRAAHEDPCDILVLGTHGRRGLSRLFLGSVAEGVLRHAACPVVTVRAGAAVGGEPVAVGRTGGAPG